MDLLSQFESSLSVKQVGIIEFAESDEYCGKTLYPGQRVLLKLIFGEELEGIENDFLDYWINGGRNGAEIEISPDARKRVEYLNETGLPHMREVILVGGRRSSKGFITGIAMAKVMWDTLQLQDPGRHYGIDPDKNIAFNCVAGSQDQAKEYQFADFSSTVESCRAFEPWLVNSLETELRVKTSADDRKIATVQRRGRKVVKDIARLRGKALAANAGTIRGSASMITVIDEMAHMMVGESKGTGDSVYNAAEPALAQFKGDGMMFLNSSPYTKVGKFFERWELGMKPATETPDDAILAFRFPSWAMYEGWQKDPSPRRKQQFSIGVPHVSPDWDEEERDADGEYVHSRADRDAIKAERAKEAADPETYKTERRSIWAEVTDSFLRPEMVDRGFAGKPIGYSGEGKLVLAPFQSNWGEGAHNYYRYVAHLDPSSNTAGFGFALGHVEEFTDHNGTASQHVIFDIVKRWRPEQFVDRVIKWEPILDELMYLAEVFRPASISFDQYQSHEPIERLQVSLMEKGIGETWVNEIVATPESNWKRAETFKVALYQGLVHMPSIGTSGRGDENDQQWAAEELKFLQQLNTNSKYPKVDRQTAGPVQTKDMADCLMTVTHALIGNNMQLRRAEQLAQKPLVAGAPGGFKIGGPDAGGRGEMPASAAMQQYRRGRVGDQMRTGPIRGAVGRSDRLRGMGGRSRGRRY
jgi:hypothetical protein